MEFRNFTIDDLETVQGYLDIDGAFMAERNFVGLFLWCDHYKVKMCIEDDCLYMCSNRSDEYMMVFPPFTRGAFRQAFIRLIEYARTINENILVNSVSETQKERLIDLFGEDKKPYLLDCAIMFIGILHNNLKYYAMAYEGRDELRIQDVIRYSLNRIIRVVDEVEKAKESLFSPELLDQWLPESNINSMDDQQILYRTILSLKKPLVHRKEAANYIELLDFIYDELLNKEEQRQFLISLAIRSLKENKELFDQAQLKKLEKIVINFNKK